MPAVVLCIRGLRRGGAEHILVREALDLAARGIPVEVWYEETGGRASDLEDAGVPLMRFHPATVRRGVRRLRARWGQVVVHSHSPSTGALLRLATVGLGSVRFVHTEHNLVTSYRPPSRILHRATARRVDFLIAVSDAVLQTAPRTADSRVIRHVDADDPRIADCLRRPAKVGGGLEVLCVASFTPKKGHDTLLDALDRLAKGSATPLSIRMVGEDGPVRSTVEARAAALVRAHPHLTIAVEDERTDVPDLLEACDLVVLPSVSEGFPLILAEAMAASTPVVATEVGGVGELVDPGVTGLLVPPQDATRLADAMAELLANEAVRSRMAVAARDRLVGTLHRRSWLAEYRALLGVEGS